MSEFTPLREAVDTLANRSLPPDFGDLKRRAIRRHRRRVALVLAATTALLAGSALAVTGLDDDRRPPPADPVTPTPSPHSEAEQIIAEGNLASFAATESGTVLTVWETCEHFDDTDCGHAWRLGTGSQPQATGMVGRGDVHVEANAASGDGFVLTPASHHNRGFLIAQDGTTSPLSKDCRDVTWSTPTEPRRLGWASGLNFVDTVAGTICDTGRLGGRPLAEGVFTADGTLWALVDNESDPEILTIGRYDGARWHYRDLAARGGSWTSVLAAAGSNIVVLVADSERAPAPDHLISLSVTTDAGANWSEVTDPNVLERDLPFSAYVAPNNEDWFSGYTSMAFAGTSVLYVADGNGYLWRSTDFATFSRVSIQGGVRDLKSAGDAVIARHDDGTACGYVAACQLNDLVRISADGSVEPITAR
jgi:hypothetical protein